MNALAPLMFNVDRTTLLTDRKFPRHLQEAMIRKLLYQFGALH